jgi:anti-sigma regulatory factor (Ser/Thr protein kinase)
MNLATSAGLNKKAAYNLRLAIDEIATNVVLYGYEREGLNGSLELYPELSGQSITIALEDTAAAYDPHNTAPPDLTSSFEERRMGGLGVYFAMNGVDEFRYERVGNRNRNIFVVNTN